MCRQGWERSQNAAMIGIVAAALLATAGCSQKVNGSSDQPKPVDYNNHIVVRLTGVEPGAFVEGKPQQCGLRGNVMNHTQFHLNGATVVVGGETMKIEDMSANTSYRETQTLAAVLPVDGSCEGVARRVMAASGSSPTDCSLESQTEGACQQTFIVETQIDEAGINRVLQAQQQAAEAYKAEQARQFEQDRAQAWQERGQLEVAVGTVFHAVGSSVISLDAVTAPDFDPTKIADTDTVATLPVHFCEAPTPVADVPTPDASDAAAPTAPIPSLPPNTLTIQTIVRDRYQLSNWFRLRMKCWGERPQFLWIRASVLNALRGNQLSSQ